MESTGIRGPRESDPATDDRSGGSRRRRSSGARLERVALGLVSALQAQQRLRVAVRDALPIGVADRKLLQECARLRHRAIRMIDREYDPSDADLEQQVEERRRIIEAAEG